MICGKEIVRIASKVFLEFTYGILLYAARDKLQQYPHELIPTLAQLQFGKLKIKNYN